jgi:quercetin dioxygenase-like cupin family protein
VRLTAGDDAWEGTAGDYVTIPLRRHSLRSLDDSVVMLTVVKNVPSE